MSLLSSVQGYLSTAQTIPVLGPVAVSPTKLVVSAAQAIGSVAGMVLLSPSVICSDSQDDFYAMGRCSDYSKAGVLSFSYAFLNIISCGCAGSLAEDGNQGQGFSISFENRPAIKI